MINREHKSADFAYIFSEKVAYKLFTPIFYRLPFTPNQVTLISFFLNNLPAVAFFSLGKYWANLVGVLFLVSAAIWDWMDGAVARKRGLSSKGGHFLDPALDFIWQNLLVAGIIFGVLRIRNGDPFWLTIGLLALVSLVVVNYLGNLYGKDFNFGFRGDYDELTKEIDSNKKARLFDKLCLEMLTYRKFIFIFLFTIRYPLLLGALFNRLDLFLILLLLTSLFKGISLFYVYFLFLEAEKKKTNRVIVEALVHRYQFWLKKNK